MTSPHHLTVELVNVGALHFYFKSAYSECINEEKIFLQSSLEMTMSFA